MGVLEKEKKCVLESVQEAKKAIDNLYASLSRYYDHTCSHAEVNASNLRVTSVYLIKMRELIYDFDASDLVIDEALSQLSEMINRINKIEGVFNLLLCDKNPRKAQEVMGAPMICSTCQDKHTDCECEYCGCELCQAWR